MYLPRYHLTRATRELLLRIQLLLDAVDLNDLSPQLTRSIRKQEKETGVVTYDYQKRLLILNETGVINDDEYIKLVRYFKQNMLPENNYLN